VWNALNCQKQIATQIVAQGGDYLLALKDNHPHMHEDVRQLFAWAAKVDFADILHDTARWKKTMDESKLAVVPQSRILSGNVGRSS
jgi:predicted transposase YbfD/YdcC